MSVLAILAIIPSLFLFSSFRLASPATSWEIETDQRPKRRIKKRGASWKNKWSFIQSKHHKYICKIQSYVNCIQKNGSVGRAGQVGRVLVFNCRWLVFDAYYINALYIDQGSTDQKGLISDLTRAGNFWEIQMCMTKFKAGTINTYRQVLMVILKNGLPLKIKLFNNPSDPNDQNV